MGRAEQMADGRSTHTVRFAAATTYLVDNVPSFYDVRFVQALDPADGVEMWIVFKLDADFVVIGSRTYLSGEI